MDGNELVRIARASLEDCFKGFDRRPEASGLERGSFVTLWKHGELRGCIGYMEALDDLYPQTYRLARQAAFHDWRFPQLEESELQQIKIEVSVLSPMREISSIEEIMVGRDGVLMAIMGHRAVFLPEVATQQGWGRTALLENLSLKAGLPRLAYQHPDAVFYTFTSEVFHEV